MYTHNKALLMKKILITFTAVVLISSCGSSDPDDTFQAALVSENAELQSAYENCVEQTRSGLKSDNPGTSQDIMKFMYEGANQTCNSAVVVTCGNDTHSSSCKLILDMYRD